MLHDGRAFMNSLMWAKETGSEKKAGRNGSIYM